MIRKFANGLTGPWRAARAAVALGAAVLMMTVGMSPALADEQPPAPETVQVQPEPPAAEPPAAPVEPTATEDATPAPVAEPRASAD